MDMDKLVALCRKRGFIFQSSEIYGGISGFWDYGPLGVELKKNVKDAWWQDMVRNPPPGPDGQEISMVGVDCAIIMNPKVWVASGHVGSLTPPTVVGAGAEEWVRANTHAPKMTMSALSAISANLRRLTCAPRFRVTY